MKKNILLLFGMVALFAGILSADELDNISLPPGFNIEVYADKIETARGMTVSPDGTLFVGSKKGNVYAVTPDRRVSVIASGLAMPVGVDYYNNDLYVSAISRILRFSNALANLDRNRKGEVIYNNLPKDRWHGWKFIKVGPDGMLYVPVGAPCNVCEKASSVYASIQRMKPDGSGVELFASGIRNTVGFDWHPVTGELWFTDNGRDQLGDDIPPDELNRAERQGLHFGFPYLHGKGVEDPQFWDRRPDIEYTPPQVEFAAHAAALGMRFYTGTMFPELYRGGIFVAQHGSWNRSEKVGYQVVFIPFQNGKPGEQRVFASGWLSEDKKSVSGRPVDVEIGLDGSLFVSDDDADMIYRIWYEE